MRLLLYSATATDSSATAAHTRGLMGAGRSSPPFTWYLQLEREGPDYGPRKQRSYVAAVTAA